MFWRNPKSYMLAFMLIILFAIPMALNAISEATMMFLAIEPSSRANGMGNAYVSVADDAYAGWWNPAATAFNKKVQFAGMHTNWLQGSGVDDLFYEYFGWNAYLQDLGNVGVNVVWMDFGSQEQTDEHGNFIRNFSSNEYSVSAIYGAEVMKDKIGVGIGFKFLYSYLGPGSGATETAEKGKTLSYAFDIGSKFKNVIVPRLDYSLVMQNVGPDVTYINDEQKDPLPMTFRTGFAYRVFDTIDTGVDPAFSNNGFKQKLTLSVDAAKILANNDPLYKRIFSAWGDDSSKYEFQSTVFSVGSEYNYLDLISLRAGYFYDKAGSITGPSFGVGFHFTFENRYRVFADFAMAAGGELVSYNKTFSLGLEY